MLQMAWFSLLSAVNCIPWLTHHSKQNSLCSHEQHVYVVWHVTTQELQTNKEPEVCNCLHKSI